MRFLPTCALLLSLSAMPGFCQSNDAANANTPTVLPADANDSSVDYSALRERLASQNKVLQGEVNTQRAIVKKNQLLLKEAQKLDASNKKLMEEKKKLETENSSLEKQRQALKASQSQVQTASVSSN
jgi:CRISPR/Cas system-associated protein endoribonuclease Cas2